MSAGSRGVVRVFFRYPWLGAVFFLGLAVAIFGSDAREDITAAILGGVFVLFGLVFAFAPGQLRDALQPGGRSSFQPDAVAQESAQSWRSSSLSDRVVEARNLRAVAAASCRCRTSYLIFFRQVQVRGSS
jgi:hypothetical protein